MCRLREGVCPRGVYFPSLVRVGTGIEGTVIMSVVGPLYEIAVHRTKDKPRPHNYFVHHAMHINLNIGAKATLKYHNFTRDM